MSEVGAIFLPTLPGHWKVERLKVHSWAGTVNNAPLAMHYLADIRPEPARGLISKRYQTSYLFDIRPEV